MTKPTHAAYGIWHVTTEGDCEGRTTKDLGTHEGYLDDIAFALGEQGGYSLKFTRVHPLELRPVCTKVHVSLDISSKTWDMKSDQRANYFRTLLVGRDVTIEESNYYAAATLIRGTSPEARERAAREVVKARALSKLSPDEIKALGLKP